MGTREPGTSYGAVPRAVSDGDPPGASPTCGSWKVRSVSQATRSWISRSRRESRLQPAARGHPGPAKAGTPYHLEVLDAAPGGSSAVSTHNPGMHLAEPAGRLDFCLRPRGVVQMVMGCKRAINCGNFFGCSRR